MASQSGKDGSDHEGKDVIDDYISYYSSCYQLKRSVAWMLRAKDYLRSKVHKTSFDVKRTLDAEDLIKAERAILRHVQ